MGLIVIYFVIVFVISIGVIMEIVNRYISVWVNNDNIDNVKK